MEYTKAEKEAIERCRELIKDAHKEWIGISNQNAIETILNLIDEQQKEIEEKDKSIFYLENEAGKIIEEELNNAKVDLYRNFIPKEAIREKIDDLQRYKGLVMYEKYNYDAIIRHLKELLGE